MDRTFSPDEWRSNHDWNPWFKPENRRSILSMLDGWHDLTEKHGCTLAQLVLAWTVAQPGVTVALCGARRPDQARDNAQVTDLELTPAEVQWLNLERDNPE